MRSMIAVVALLTVASCTQSGSTPSPSPSHVGVGAQASAEPAAATPTPWTCAAYCVLEYNCTSNGDSTWRSLLKVSKGDTAAASFKALVEQCNNAVERLVTHFECTGGKDISSGATIESSCARS
jgi:hypothetical protein